MVERILSTPDDLDAWFRYLSGRTLPITVSSVDGRDRSGQQNRLQFLWAREAADQFGDRTPDEVRHDWKLRHGIPILREENADFQATYDRIIRPLTYEQKVKAMAIIEVSSLFKVRQMVRYLDAIQRECAEQGIKLTDPDPELRAYQARYREPKARAA